MEPSDQAPAQLTTPMAPTSPGDLAWFAATPVAIATIVAILVLGPPLGHDFLEPGPERFLDGVERLPEPVEHARYLLALLGPPALAAAILVLSRRRTALHRTVCAVLRWTTHLLLLAFLAVCFLALNDVLLQAHVYPYGSDPLFPHAALAAAVAVPLLLLLALRIRRLAAAVARVLTRETRPRVVIASLVVCVVTAAWLLTAVNTEATAPLAPGSNLIPWDMSEAFAVLDGRTPLVDFHSQYTELWAFPLAAAMALFGSTIGVWTISLAVLNGAALLAIYDVLRRIAHSSLLALLLFLPLLSAGFVRDIPVRIFTLWPLRYAGPYLVAWLLARHVGGGAPRSARLVYAAAGLAAINNPEFGIGAFAATLVALACANPPRRRVDAAAMLRDATVGALVSVLLVCLLTLARAGSLPHLAWVLEFPRLFGTGGWVLEPMATFGFHLVVYATFAAAITTAVVRGSRGGEEPVLTAMLAWSGVFGLLAGSYFVGRSDPTAIVTLFSAWGFSLVLLLVVVVRDLAARAWRRPGIPELAVLFGFGLMLTTLVQLPTPASQLDRLRTSGGTLVFEQEEAKHFVARTTRRGENVAILIPLGHRIAYDLGLQNVSPYASTESIATQEAMDRTLDAVHSAHIHSIFIAKESAHTAHLVALERAGFVTRRASDPYVELSDRGPAPR